MSEIQRYTPHHTGHSHLGTTMAPATIPAPSGYVLFTDHEAAIEERDARIEEQARTIRALYKSEAATQRMFWTANADLADAKARIEGLRFAANVVIRDSSARYNRAIDDCLAALTQPQTEIEGKPDGTWYDIPDGGGAATAAGVADAEHERRLETNRLLWNRVARLEEALRVIRGPEDRGPWMLIYRNAGGGYAGLQAIAETALAPEDSEPSPYAKAFRERVCPVPEFPGIKKEES